MATTDREKEREAELEGTMYTNCLLLGLDPAILGSPAAPHVGLFRHSNPCLGEQLLLPCTFAREVCPRTSVDGSNFIEKRKML